MIIYPGNLGFRHTVQFDKTTGGNLKKESSPDFIVIKILVCRPNESATARISLTSQLGGDVLEAASHQPGPRARNGKRRGKKAARG